MYPGHHAERSVYGGYCFLNNGAICAKSLQANNFGNIAILALEFIDTNKIDALIIAFGGDTYKNNPDASSLCRCGLDIPDYELIGRHIIENIESDIPIIVTQEGSYDMEHMDKISYSFLKGLTKN
jgi:acetoin utilization deacetylase AcuC-like enzyme